MGEYSEVRESGDVRAVANEIQRAGEAFGYIQKTVSAGMYLFYKTVAYALEDRERRVQFEGLCTFIVALLDLGAKMVGNYRRVGGVVERSAEVGEVAEVRDVVVGGAPAIRFRRREQWTGLRIDEHSLLMGEGLISTCVCFDFNFPDLYERLGEKMRDGGFPERTSKCAWILLNDSFRLPMSVYFSGRCIVQGCISLGRRIVENKQGTEAKEKDSLMVEEELVRMYLRNFKDEAAL